MILECPFRLGALTIALFLFAATASAEDISKPLDTIKWDIARITSPESVA